MKLVRLENLFDIKLGVNLDLCNLETDPAGIPFVSRSGTNNGISAYVKLLPDIEPNPEGTLSIALGGSILSTFLQEDSYYSGQNLVVATPKVAMTDRQLLYYCLCIKSNAFRYSTCGREANRTVQEIKVPTLDSIPDWVETIQIPELNFTPVESQPLDTSNWQWFNYPDLFDIKRGSISSLGEYEEGLTPVVTASSVNNGVSAHIDKEPDFKDGQITVSINGSIGEAFCQEQPFCLSPDVVSLTPKFNLTKNIAQFLCVLIRLEKPRYNYGYKWGTERMKRSKIKLPTKDGAIDWDWIETYMKQFNYCNLT